jgi:hypothetical protein
MHEICSTARDIPEFAQAQLNPVSLLPLTKLTKKLQENSTQHNSDQLKVGCNEQLAHNTGQTPHANQREKPPHQTGAYSQRALARMRRTTANGFQFQTTSRVTLENDGSASNEVTIARPDRHRVGYHHTDIKKGFSAVSNSVPASPRCVCYCTRSYLRYTVVLALASAVAAMTSRRCTMRTT